MTFSSVLSNLSRKRDEPMPFQFSPDSRRGGSRSRVTTTKQSNGTETHTQEYDSWDQTSFETFVETLGVSGIIAVLIMVTACSISLVQVVRGATPDLPNYLINAFSLILGYYFGQKVKSKSDRPIRQKKRRQAGFRPPPNGDRAE